MAVARIAFVASLAAGCGMLAGIDGMRIADDGGGSSGASGNVDASGSSSASSSSGSSSGSSTSGSSTSSSSGSSGDASTDAPPDGAVVWPTNGHTYVFVTTPELAGIAWTEANTRAQQQGGHLVTITSSAEQQFVLNLALAHPTVTFLVNWDGPFIGAQRVATPPDAADGWAWVTGEPWSFTTWAAGQPDDYLGTENCGKLVNKPATGWDDGTCTEKHRAYIVEFE